jgi:inorganic pyrophosphatase
MLATSQITGRREAEITEFGVVVEIPKGQRNKYEVDLCDIDNVPAFDQLEIRHFFEVYKALEPGKSVDARQHTD